MIRELTTQDIPLITDIDISMYVNDLYSIGICFDDSTLSKFILVKFNPITNAWKIDKLHVHLNNHSDIRILLSLVNYVVKYAEERGFFQFFTTVDVKYQVCYMRMFKKYVSTEYEIATDELVLAKKRPTVGIYWDWLFSSTCKEVDTIVLHHFLKQSKRKQILGY